MPIYKRKIEPIVVNDKNDLRLRSYNDSLSLYDKGISNKIKYANAVSNAGLSNERMITSPISISRKKISPINEMYIDETGGGTKRLPNGAYDNYTTYLGKDGVDKKYLDNSRLNNFLQKSVELYKRPVQPIIYKKEIPVETTVQPIIEPKKDEKPIYDYNGTYITASGFEKPITQSEYHKQKKLNYKFGRDFEASNPLNKK